MLSVHFQTDFYFYLLIHGLFSVHSGLGVVFTRGNSQIS